MRAWDVLVTEGTKAAVVATFASRHEADKFRKGIQLGSGESSKLEEREVEVCPGCGRDDGMAGCPECADAPEAVEGVVGRAAARMLDADGFRFELLDNAMNDVTVGDDSARTDEAAGRVGNSILDLVDACSTLLRTPEGRAALVKAAEAEELRAKRAGEV